MKRMFSLVLVATWLGGCAANPMGAAVFTWYHPQGGEYLFAFDQGQCKSQRAPLAQATGADIRDPFFACMEQRGYSLIDDQGRLLGVVDSIAQPAAKVSHQ